ncbi:MAG: hypothetical protein Q9227_006007 [Pyrenula ochraceoflavens]
MAVYSSLLQLLLTVLLSPLAQTAPTPGLGVKFNKRSNSTLPTLTLSDAAYQASSYDIAADIYKWTNIRFAAPPVGDLRWAKPTTPNPNSTLQDGSYGNACVQAPIEGLNIVGDLSDTAFGNAVDNFLRDIENPVLSGGAEDCLFLDLYVPGKAVRSPTTTSLSVIHWFYGGGYILGDKQQLTPILPLYDGTGLITESSNNVIFVASNYRLGAFGFLAGTTVENQGLPNAGLWDQRAALQWTQDNIHLVGGDSTAVTAMGESAGAGSIFHHLVGEGGTLDPLYQRAIMLSPAFEPLWDRAGTLQSTYEDFASLAGCNGQGLDCLRAADSATLIAANKALNEAATPGTFVVGPSADGDYIRQAPQLEYASGNFYNGIEGAIITHTSDESTLFVNGDIKTDSDFATFLTKIFPNYTLTDGLQTIIQLQYPNVTDHSATNLSVPNPQGPFADEGDRVRAFIRDSSSKSLTLLPLVTCNVRIATQAYSGKSYNLQYSLLPGWHGTDILPAFLTFDALDSALSSILLAALPLFGSFSQVYKSYLTSFARSGDPNTYARFANLPPAVQWPLADASGEQVQGVVDAGSNGVSYTLLTGGDEMDKFSTCDFWLQWIAAATEDGGYAPPGAVVEQDLIQVRGDPSRNY